MSTPMVQATLDNGLRVLLQPLPGTQTVALCLHIGTGFRNEPFAGAAHLTEHVLVHGHPGSRSPVTAVAAAGGTTNARTTADHTQYTQLLPAAGLELGLTVERDRLLLCEPDADMINRQIAVVQAEIRRNVLQRPHGGLVLFDLPVLLHDTWANRHNGYGDFEALADLAPADIAAFLDQAYPPGNIHLAVAGDFDPATALDAAARLLGTLPSGAATPPPGSPPAEAPLTTGRQALRHETVAANGRTALGFRVPDPCADHPAYLATVLLSELLETVGPDCGAHTRHPWDRLRARVHRTGNPFDITRDSLLAVEIGHPADTSPPDTEECLRAVLTRLADGTLPLDGLLRPLQRELALHLHAELDSVAGQASWLAVGAAVHGDPHYLSSLPDALARVALADVAQAAAHYAAAPTVRLTSRPGTAPARPLPALAERATT
jgi:zinc protease